MWPHGLSLYLWKYLSQVVLIRCHLWEFGILSGEAQKSQCQWTRSPLMVVL